MHGKVWTGLWITVMTASLASVQTFTPPPARGNDIPGGSNHVMLDLGYGKTSAAETIGTAPEYSAFPALTATYMFGLRESIGLGAQLHWNRLDLTGGDDGSILSFTGFNALHANIKSWNLDVFLGMGFSRVEFQDSVIGVNYVVGAIASTSLGDRWQLKPFIQSSQANPKDLRLSVFAIGWIFSYKISDESALNFGFVYESQKFDTPAVVDGNSNGFGLIVGYSITITI